LRAELEPLQLSVLATLHRFRLLTTTQIQRLHVAGGAPSSRLRRTQNLLKRLHGLGLVARLSRVIGGVRAGSSGYIYGLSGLGQAVLEVGGSTGARRRQVWESKPPFQDHMLGVAELYVRLRELEGLSAAELLTFDTEPRAWRHFTGSGGELVVVKPDAFVVVGFSTVERRAFIEVDRATESLPTIERKSTRYVAYWRSATEQQRHGVFPQVVWLVPDEHRRAGIEQALGRLAVEASKLFAVALSRDGPSLLMTPPFEEASDQQNSRAPP
jgi:hypothetical protein